MKSVDRDLLLLAADVLKSYGISPDSISVIQSGTIKTVWKIGSKDGHLCLKRLKQTYDKALFSVNAQIYIRHAGGTVPRIFLDRSNRLIVNHNGELFVLYEWLQGRDLNFADPGDLRAAVIGLAEFHKASKGYVPPEDSRISSKLSRWPEQYESMKNRMTAWKLIATNDGKPVSCDSAYLASVDAMVSLADIAVKMLNKTRYMEMTAAGSHKIVLCHQDYGPGNAILTGKGVAVLDLDGVTMDLPARDLRKIIGKISENRNKWDIGLIADIIQWYGSANPTDTDEKEVLYADLLFPHWYFGLVKNRFDNGKQVKASEIERIAALEQSKIPVLMRLLKKE